MTNRIYGLILAFCLNFSFAQEIKLDSIKAEGRILPTTINKVDENYQIITKAQIEQTPAQSLDELLSFYSGVDVKRRGIIGVQSDISVRGGTFEQVLVLINGVRMSDAQTAHNQMHIPLKLDDIDKVEIIKGPASRRYGANAYAGVINIITKTNKKNNITLNAQGASYGTYNVGVGANIGKGKLSHKVQANYGASDGYRYNTDFENKNLWYQNSLELKKGKLNFQAGFGEKKFGANGFYSTPTAVNQYEEVQSSLVSTSYEQKGDKFSWRTNAFWKRSQDKYIFVRQDPSIYRNLHIGNTLGGDISGHLNSKFGTTGIGVDFRNENLSSNNLGPQNRSITTLFLEHNFSFFDNKLNITPGISWANITKQGDFFFPGIELGFNINKQHKVYAHSSKVHRVPSFTELFYVSRTDQGNPNLIPEEAMSYEFGYRSQKPSLLTKVSVFYRDTDNLIDWVKETEEEKWSPQNIANVKTLGAEFNLTKKFNGFVKSFNIDYTYLNTDISKTSNFSRYSNQSLRHQFIARLENRLYKSLSSQVVFRYLNRVNLDDYSLVDLKLNYTQPKWSAFIQLNNVLGEEYKEANLVPMPGRWVNVGAKYSFNLK